MFAALRARGLDEGALARIEAPVGAPIGAESPAEIAISILASVVASHKGVARVGAAQSEA
jgi:xanthine dehydrogenase accessory factor